MIGSNWFVNGYLNYQTKEINIFPRLFEMNNLDYQRDWIQAMNEFQLKEQHNTELNSGIIYFKVPPGKEMEWKNRFETFAIVDWAELNYIVEIDLHNN